MAYIQYGRNILRLMKTMKDPTLLQSSDRVLHHPLLFAGQGVRYRKLEVILTTTIDKLGKAGETVKVAPGYFRNHLMPKLRAVPNIDKFAYLISEQRKIYEPKEVEEVKVVKKTDGDKMKEYQAAAKRLDSAKLVLKRFGNADNELRSPVTKDDILAEKRACSNSIVTFNKMVLVEHMASSLGSFKDNRGGGSGCCCYRLLVGGLGGEDLCGQLQATFSGTALALLLPCSEMPSFPGLLGRNPAVPCQSQHNRFWNEYLFDPFKPKTLISMHNHSCFAPAFQIDGSPFQRPILLGEECSIRLLVIQGISAPYKMMDLQMPLLAPRSGLTSFEDNIYLGISTDPPYLIMAFLVFPLKVARQLFVNIEPENLHLPTPLSSFGEFELPLRLPKSIPLPPGKVQWILNLKIRRKCDEQFLSLASCFLGQSYTKCFCY
ncbi:ribosomal protein L9/RNase H1 [Actinidia rufa]|uniref:Large ribosomal subunit protein bL9c n=1 Tax=Actinidia rufa TaxID=165716 RepID=A0A7J0DCG2_9ERIC|nr:ribosomal protein L9/RNase H1 [Actinidia rufa]